MVERLACGCRCLRGRSVLLFCACIMPCNKDSDTRSNDITLELGSKLIDDTFYTCTNPQMVL